MRKFPLVLLILSLVIPVEFAEANDTLSETSSTSNTEVDLSSLSIEELLEIEVTSVSKHRQKLNESAAAVFVITKEDIRRSGATSIPEILRMVPGLDIARVSSSLWAVSARGFNGAFADKLLTMIDGRAIYTPIFSGTIWDEHDLVLEDINRIEVIRGPGATLWGANAVNGVINIITDSAADTKGALASIVSGTEDRLIASTRYGATVCLQNTAPAIIQRWMRETQA